MKILYTSFTKSKKQKYENKQKGEKMNQTAKTVARVEREREREP